MKRFSVQVMLEGVLHDAGRLLRDGDTKGAYKILRHKITEIEKIDSSIWGELDW